MTTADAGIGGCFTDDAVEQAASKPAPQVSVPPATAGRLGSRGGLAGGRGGRDPVFEPKWGGWRAVACGGRVWSRRGVDLTRYLPDLAPVLAARLPADQQPTAAQAALGLGGWHHVDHTADHPWFARDQLAQRLAGQRSRLVDR